MERFSQQPASELAANYARSRFSEEIANSTMHPDGYVCQNCTRVVQRVTLVPEFEYLGCDDCMAEALAVIAREAEDALIVRRPVERMQGQLPFGSEVA